MLKKKDQSPNEDIRGLERFKYVVCEKFLKYVLANLMLLWCPF